LLALLSCMVEARIDMHKLSKFYRRPEPLGRKDIGMWVFILNIVGWIAVATNIAIICFVTSDLDDLLGLAEDDETRLTVFIILEHLILGLTWLVSRGASSPGADIQEHYQRQDYVVQALERYATSVKEVYASWENWTPKELENYLHIQGGEKHKAVAKKFHEQSIAGKVVKTWREEDVNKKVKANHEERKWAWKMIEDLKHTPDRDEEMLAKLVRIAEKARDVWNHNSTTQINDLFDGGNESVDFKTSTHDDEKLDFSIFDFADFIKKTPQLREKIFGTFGSKRQTKDGEEVVITFESLPDVLNSMIHIYLLQHSSKREAKGLDDKKYEGIITKMVARIKTDWTLTYNWIEKGEDLDRVAKILENYGIEVDDDGYDDQLVIPLLDQDEEAEEGYQGMRGNTSMRMTNKDDLGQLNYADMGDVDDTNSDEIEDLEELMNSEDINLLQTNDLKSFPRETRGRSTARSQPFSVPDDDDDDSSAL